MKIRGMRTWFVLITLLVLAAGALGPSTARGIQPAAVEELVLLRLKYATFDPLQGEPQVDAALRTDAYPGAGEGAYIVQFKGPIQGAWKGQVRALGGRVMDYLPDYAFLVWMDSAVRERVAALDTVRWVGLYQPAYKLSPNLDRSKPLYRVVLFEGANLAAVESRLAELDTPTSEVSAEQFALFLPEGGVDLVAAWPEVLWIENRPLYRVSNDIATGILGAPTAWSSGYTGLGQKITVADTGIDTGVDASGVADMHADFDDRFKTEPTSQSEIRSYPVDGSWAGCAEFVGDDDGAADLDSGHGTHVLGSVLGDGGASSGAIKGTAYEATPTFQAVEQWTTWTGLCAIRYDPGYYLTGLPLDLYPFFEDAYDWGSQIHSNSWGSPEDGLYTEDSRAVDRFMWDQLWDDEADMLILFAAGNAGVDGDVDGFVDEDSLDAPGTAKNALTVGASDNERDSGGYNPGGDCDTWGTCWPNSFPYVVDTPTSIDRISDVREELAAFSSRGPANDGRIKPDVVAPGTNILSTRSSVADAADYYAWGPYNDYYMYMGGTSMATPLAAGAAALVREYYGEAFGHTTPSAALLKATLINSAVDIAGYGYSGEEAGQPIPNNHEGWGLVDVDAATSGQREFVDGDSVGTDDTLAYYYNVGSSTIPLKVTLVWSDYPASAPSAGALVNDLDLRITAEGGTTYLGNVFTSGWSVTGGVADSINNVESVYIESPAPGQWTVEVAGSNVSQASQPFALVVTGYFGPPPDPPVAAFSADTLSGEAPLVVDFTDESTGEITSWLWDFGDEGTSTLPDPSHEYATPGDYTVSLTVTNLGGSDTHTEPNYVHVTDPGPPVADFSGTPRSGDALLNVSFTDESEGVITDWLWDFGDEGTSTEEDPSHLYTAEGDYTVSLTVTGPGGEHTETKTNYIQVTGPPEAIYLPLVFRSYPAPDPIVNGDFEDGRLVGWDEWSFNRYHIVVDQEEAGIQPHSGDWLAWLGGAKEELAYMEQTVTIPSGRSYLHFWHWLYSWNDQCTTDRALLLVGGETVKTYVLCEDENTPGWMEQVVDLSAYVGQSVSLRFSIETTENPSSWYVDDVSFKVSAATADVSPFAAPVPGMSAAEEMKTRPRTPQP